MCLVKYWMIKHFDEPWFASGSWKKRYFGRLWRTWVCNDLFGGDTGDCCRVFYVGSVHCRRYCVGGFGWGGGNKTYRLLVFCLFLYMFGDGVSQKGPVVVYCVQVGVFVYIGLSICSVVRSAAVFRSSLFPLCSYRLPFIFGPAFPSVEITCE